jgi:hypothetical protein
MHRCIFVCVYLILVLEDFMSITPELFHTLTTRYITQETQVLTKMERRNYAKIVLDIIILNIVVFYVYPHRVFFVLIICLFFVFCVFCCCFLWGFFLCFIFCCFLFGLFFFHLFNSFSLKSCFYCCYLECCQY